MRIDRRLGGLLALALMTGAGGCTTSGPGSEASGSASGSPGSVVRSAGGTVTATVGDPVETTVDGSAGIELRLSVDEIRVLESCPGRADPTQRPDFGHFVVLEVTATLRAPSTDPSDLPTGASTYVGLGAERFRVSDPAGTVQETTSTAASWACFEDSELLPAFVDVGQTVSGYVVLDSPTPHGAVAFSPDDAPGWEWRF